MESISFIDRVIQEIMQSSGFSICLTAVKSLIKDIGLVCCGDIDISDVGCTFHDEILPT